MSKELSQCIGRAARAARNSLGLTQEDTAERINVSVEFYARIERGHALPSIVTFARLVSALGVSADALLGLRPVGQVAVAEAPWVPEPPRDGPELRRIIRRLRSASPAKLRIVGLLVRHLEGTTTK